MDQLVQVAIIRKFRDICKWYTLWFVYHGGDLYFYQQFFINKI